jgi:3-oxoacyl-[acyl-carrier protein] reductase
MSAVDGAELPDDPLSIFELTGRVAIVTGAAGGVGRGCAEALAAAGAHVVCADLKNGDRTTEIIRSRGGSAESVSLDVADKGAVEALVDDVVERRGRLDVMINNAGIHIRAAALETSEQELDRIYAVNAKGVIFGCQAAGRVMAQQGFGSVINIASEAIDRPAAEILAYSASKAAVRQATRTFAIELSPKGVRFNTIAPGWMLTPLTEQLNAATEDKSAAEALAERLQARAAIYPLGRTGTPADVAYAALYLASDASSWMTGQALRLNGGGSMPW